MTYCECCGAPFDRLGGITITLGYVCYQCVKWIHVVSDETAALRDRSLRQVLSDIDQIP